MVDAASLGLLNLGAVGVVLGWFMFRQDTRLTRIEAALERLTRALMLSIINSGESVDSSVKGEARRILNELNGNRENRRGT